MSQDQNAQDPLEFVRGMWNQMGFSLPGMVTPTLDVDELDKRITDMRAVEGWLKMNLNMLQMSIQGLEMQRAALAAVKAMSQQAQQTGEAGGDAAGNPFAGAAWWADPHSPVKQQADAWRATRPADAALLDAVAPLQYVDWYGDWYTNDQTETLARARVAEVAAAGGVPVFAAQPPRPRLRPVLGGGRRRRGGLRRLDRPPGARHRRR